MAKVVTANRLGDGLVVYWAGSGQWVESLDGALLIETPEETARAEEEAAKDVVERVVVGVYAFDAEQDGARIAALHYREQIRSRGPSVRPDLGKQATYHQAV